MKADPKAEAAAPSSKKKLMIIVVASVLVLAAGGGAAAWFLTQDGAAPAKKEHKAAKAGPPEYVPVDSFTVNLQPETGEQYLQVQFTLQVPNAEQGEVFKANMAQVRSRVLLLLSGKKASEINTVDGKRQLAGEILATLKAPFVDKGEPQEVIDVLFTSFIIQ
jgi:flagellar FliL protein